jgi:hypothetical protein
VRYVNWKNKTQKGDGEKHFDDFNTKIYVMWFVIVACEWVKENECAILHWITERDMEREF